MYSLLVQITLPFYNFSNLFLCLSILLVALATAMKKLGVVKHLTKLLQRYLVLNQQLFDHRLRACLFIVFYSTSALYALMTLLSSHQFFSGTHAITCALFALLRPGDEVTLCIFFLFT